MHTQALNQGALLLHGIYRIDGVLGHGGFGITYLATDVNLDKQVAIKEFFPKVFCKRDGATSGLIVGTNENEVLVERLKAKFLKEARNIARLNHPNIIKIYSAFEQNDTAYYVMELIDGPTLNEMVKLTGPLDESLAISYITRIGRALQYLHDNKITHLDVKPGNIMVRKIDGEPVLIDFGLSKQYDDNGQQTSSTPLGVSHGYAPMEQYHGGRMEEFSPESDIYSLAATLYYLVTGDRPPHCDDIFNSGLTFPHSFPKHLIQVITKAMSPRRSDRYHSVTQFLEALAPIVIEDPEIVANNNASEKTDITDEEQKGYTERNEFFRASVNVQRKENAPHKRPLNSGKNVAKRWIITIVVALFVIIATGIVIYMVQNPTADKTERISIKSSYDDLEAGKMYLKYKDDQSVMTEDDANYIVDIMIAYLVDEADFYGDVKGQKEESQEYKDARKKFDDDHHNGNYLKGAVFFYAEGMIMSDKSLKLTDAKTKRYNARSVWQNSVR